MCSGIEFASVLVRVLHRVRYFPGLLFDLVDSLFRLLLDLPRCAVELPLALEALVICKRSRGLFELSFCPIALSAHRCLHPPRTLVYYLGRECNRRARAFLRDFSLNVVICAVGTAEGSSSAVKNDQRISNSPEQIPDSATRCTSW